MAELDSDDGRCMRNDGRRWRCRSPRFGGSRFCEKHHQYYYDHRRLVPASDDGRCMKATGWHCRSPRPGGDRSSAKHRRSFPRSVSNAASGVRVSGASMNRKKGKKRKQEAITVSNPSIEKKRKKIESIRDSDPTTKLGKKRGRKPKVKKLDAIVEKKRRPRKRNDLDPSGNEKKRRRRKKREGPKTETIEEDEEGGRVMALGQVWAFSKESDGIPRSYARIDRIIPIPIPSVVRVTPLIPRPVMDEEKLLTEQGLSLACGLFEAAEFTLDKEISAFTHKVRFEVEEIQSSFFKIFPKKGEIWAVYLKWVQSMMSFEYKLVEIDSDFNDEDGVNVFGLVRVQGMEGVYRRQQHEGFYLVRNFSRGVMSMFSHQVPASRMVEGGEMLWSVALH